MSVSPNSRPGNETRVFAQPSHGPMAGEVCSVSAWCSAVRALGAGQCKRLVLGSASAWCSRLHTCCGRPRTQQPRSTTVPVQDVTGTEIVVLTARMCEPLDSTFLTAQRQNLPVQTLMVKVTNFNFLPFPPSSAQAEDVEITYVSPRTRQVTVCFVPRPPNE